MSVQFPPPPVPAFETTRPGGAGYAPRVQLPQEPQRPVQIPGVDIAIEVVGDLPVQTKILDVTRLLGVRQLKQSGYRAYPATILELLTLVERNPARPHGRAWQTVMALTIRFDAETARVSMEYCIEHCGQDPRTGAFEPQRRMVVYSAPEAEVVKKADKKLASLKKYASVAGPP